MHKKYHEKFKILDILAVTTQAHEGIETLTAAQPAFHSLQLLYLPLFLALLNLNVHLVKKLAQIIK